MRLIIYLLIALIVVISGCQNDSTQKTKPTEPVNESFIQSHNTFGFDLLQQIAESESDNVFISPTSILVALSMLYNGADGVTKDEIAEILQVDGIDAVTLNESNAALLAALDSDTDDITLKLANSLWINDAFEFQELFAEQMNDYYHALIEAIDINDEKSLHMINDWVSDATNEKIKKMIDFIPSNMVALIMNAIYLDASWTMPFDENLTETKPFSLLDGTEITVPLMMLHENFSYLENDDFQALQLTYGAEEEMNMTVILPSEDASIDELMNKMNQKNWEKWQSQFAEKDGTILLPKFTLEYEITLNDTLAALGMPSAFNEEAELTNLVAGSNNFIVSEVKHKSFLDINEEGTEAAAVTSIMIVEMSAVDQDEPFYMEVNRPFIIAITDDATDAILFLGVIKNPS